MGAPALPIVPSVLHLTLRTPSSFSPEPLAQTAQNTSVTRASLHQVFASDPSVSPCRRGTHSVEFKVQEALDADRLLKKNGSAANHRKTSQSKQSSLGPQSVTARGLAAAAVIIASEDIDMHGSVSGTLEDTYWSRPKIHPEALVKVLLLVACPPSVASGHCPEAVEHWDKYEA